MALQHLTINVVEGKNKNYAFVAWINPQKYKFTFGIKTVEDTPPMAQPGSTKIASYPSDRINFNLILDTTGLIASPLGSLTMPADGVASLIEEFLDKIARPCPSGNSAGKIGLCQPVLQLSWAQLQFRCILSGLDIEYKLFKPDGTPIRAELNLTFTASPPEPTTPTPPGQDASALAAITKQVTVVEGDTLPSLCAQIYGDPTMYILIAQYNGLFSFRDITAGTQLLFPPLSSVK